MEEIYTNIYKDSRKRAGLEQSEAADMIHDWSFIPLFSKV